MATSRYWDVANHFSFSVSSLHAAPRPSLLRIPARHHSRFIRQPAHPPVNLAKMLAFSTYAAGTAVSKESDRLFAQPLAQVPDFAFNEDVVRVFPDMIKRSVPGYPTIVENLGVLAAQFAQPNSVLYDLGSSLGAVTQALRRHVRTDGCRVIAVDNSAAMVERCREYLNGQDSMFQELLPVEVIEGDILALEFQPASVVALNFTLQFIAPEQHRLAFAHPPIAAARWRADSVGEAALQRPRRTGAAH